MYQKILVPLDGSAASKAALTEATRLAHACGARLRVMHVLDELDVTNGFETAETYCAEVLPRMRQFGDSLLEAGRTEAQAAGVAADTALCRAFGGSAAASIVDMAASWGADLIVAGTHGRRGWNRLVMGSDAEAILRTSPVPVLLVKGPIAHAEEAPAGTPAVRTA
jgi:nucleotide-binding universal stress UspA family protein